MFAPEVFDHDSIEAAKAIILTGGGGLSTDERWLLETAWLVQRIKFETDEVVVDYGCGIGRMAKEISNPVLGVDISASMREFAVEYVGKTSFSTVYPALFRRMVESGYRCGGVMAIWSLQHVPDLLETVNSLIVCLRRGGLMWVLDLGTRCVPSIAGNLPDDGYRLWDLLAVFCDLESSETLDIWPENPGNCGVLKKYRKR